MLDTKKEHMINILRHTFVAILLLVTGLANAALVSVTGKVTSTYSYSDFGTGDVVFQMNSIGVGCEAGFWLRPTDPGFKSNLSFLLAAQLSGRTVAILGYNDSIWGGSSGKFCRLYQISIQ